MGGQAGAALDKIIGDLLQITAKDHFWTLGQAFSASAKLHGENSKRALKPDLIRRVRALVESEFQQRSVVFENERRNLVEPLVVGIRETFDLTLDETQYRSLVTAVLRNPAEAWHMVIGADREKILRWLSGQVQPEGAGGPEGR